MCLRALPFLLALLAALSIGTYAAHAAPTATEAAALAAAHADHTAYTLPPEALAKAHALATRRHVVYFGGVLWSMLSLFLLLQLRIAAGMSALALRVSNNRWAQGFTFFFQFLLLITLLGLPLEIYSQTVQRSYGLSVQGWPSWFADQGKSFVLTYLFGALLVMLLFRLIRKSPRRWWLWGSFAAMGVALAGIFISPYVIDPLFNRFEPLSQSNPALVQQLQRVVAKGQGIEIPPERMFLMKASDKVTTLNAYVTGFGASKRVVVWDTSIAKGTPDQILFIFGHEMGHYVLGHIVTGLLFAFAMILVLFWIGFHIFHFLLRSFGARWNIAGQQSWSALVVLILVINVLLFFASPLFNGFSRTQEHAADVYGMEVVHGIVENPQRTAQSAFDLLGANSFVDPEPSSLIEFWTGSHSPIWLRAAFARHYDPWAPQAQPKYLTK